jgi:hypothetical protein
MLNYVLAQGRRLRKRTQRTERAKPHTLGQTENFNDYISSTPNRVLSVRIMSATSRIIERITGKLPSERLTMLLIAAAPALLNVLLVPFGEGCRGDAGWLWLPYFGILIYCLVAFSLRSWFGLIRVGKHLDTFLNTRENREALAFWTERATNLRAQVLISVAGVAGAVFAVSLVSPTLPAHIDICPASYVVAVIVGGLGANAMYWLVRAPFMILRLHKLREVRVREFDPIRTPAILGVTRLLGAWALRASIGMGADSVPFPTCLDRHPPRCCLEPPS